MPSPWAWKAAPRLMLSVLAVNVIWPSTATGDHRHTVTQAYTFKIREGGKVDVQMDIEFLIDAGATLSGSYKSILDSTSFKRIENGQMRGTDSSGGDVTIDLKDLDGWLQASFTFPAEVIGDGLTKYRVSFFYTVLDGICSGRTELRFYFPWAHRWIETVTESTYRIEFPDNIDAADHMNKVCLAGTGFYRLCGSASPPSTTHLLASGASAEHTAKGHPHGLFFRWPRGLECGAEEGCVSDVSQACPGCGAEEGCVSEEAAARARSAEGQMLPQKESLSKSAAPTVVVVLVILLCCALAVASALIRRRKHRQRTPEDGKFQDKGHERHEDEDEDDDDAFLAPEEQGSGMMPLSPVPATSVGHSCQTVSHQDSEHFNSSPICPPPQIIRTPASSSSAPPLPWLVASPASTQPRSVGSPFATAGITLDFEDSEEMGNPASQERGNPAWEQAQRRWQGFGEYYSIESPRSPSGPSSPSGASSSTSPSPNAKALDGTHFLSVGSGIADSLDADGASQASGSPHSAPARPLSPPSIPIGTHLFAEDDSSPEAEDELGRPQELLALHSSVDQHEDSPGEAVDSAEPYDRQYTFHCNKKVAATLPVVHEDEVSREDSTQDEDVRLFIGEL